MLSAFLCIGNIKRAADAAQMSIFTVFAEELSYRFASRKHEEYYNSTCEGNYIQRYFKSCITFVLRQHRKSGEELYNAKKQQYERCERFESLDSRKKGEGEYSDSGCDIE